MLFVTEKVKLEVGSSASPKISPRLKTVSTALVIDAQIAQGQSGWGIVRHARRIAAGKLISQRCIR